MGKIVQQRGGTKFHTVKKPVDMVRQPVPPRVPNVRAIPFKEVEVRSSLQTNPEKFSEAQARQLQILPPKFTEKNLHTKKKDDKGDTMQIKVNKGSKPITAEASVRSRSQRMS